MTVNPVAAGGFTSAAATYARIRPTYARPAIGAIKDLCRGGGTVLDLAAGTGILTGQLVRAGLDLRAVEPLDAMARQFRLSLPAVPIVLGVAEALPVADHEVDVLTVGQGFHWFDADAALAEASRVLRPGGVLALVWNARDEATPWVDELTRLVEERTGGRPYIDHRERPWSEVVAASGGFTPLEEHRYPNPVPTTLDGVLDRLRSTSFVAALDEPDREALLDEARRLLAGHPELTGTFDYPHETVLHTCRTLPV
ncbi:class I SAM-dependent methyltransferase [Dermatobacter hominis]|uniref:class I SAM-dependent methyltransferase n=1 Tax=Dermatobacter hominis TaxID=2884263 RepID=UPI001D0FF322|nr:class I SAM-dependent methyltransferase [Dermatobacter hominis]UDY35444.1 methyltransferase domain-containing protein [Dermatobacter hominis]